MADQHYHVGFQVTIAEAEQLAAFLKQMREPVEYRDDKKLSLHKHHGSEADAEVMSNAEKPFVITLEHLQEVSKQFLSEYGANDFKILLEKYGAHSLSQVERRDYAEFFDEIQQVLPTT